MRLSRPPSAPGGGGLLNPAGRAGPRRLALVAGGGIGVALLVGAVALGGSEGPAASRDALARRVDPLPGGPNSTPAQDAVARVADTRAAGEAMAAGRSFTPPIAPSRPQREGPPGVEAPEAQPAFVPAPPPRVGPQPAVEQPAPNPAAVPDAVRAPPVIPAAWRVPEPAAPAPQAPPPVVQVQASAGDQALVEGYRRQIGELFSGWGSRPPRTDVVAPLPTAAGEAGPRAPETRVPGLPPGTARPQAVGQTLPPDVPRPGAREVVIPAGRGIYAVTILAASSDQASPVVLQATSGPFAGERMIGTFSREGERLVIRVNSLTLRGETVNVQGVVVSPDTMETGVASGVDQRYAERFVLPAAAAFVAGLGQAIATTSRVQGVLSPFGGVGFAQNLNIGQQLGIAAGAAGARIGQTLNQETPRGPRITLDAGSQVGVMFLADVVAGRG